MTLNPFHTADFPPRWLCGPAWHAEPMWGWMHIVPDLINAAVYLAVPITVLFFLRKRPDVEYRTLYLWFSAVFGLCAAVHLIDAVIFYWPLYRLQGMVKVALACVSFGTLIALVRLLPKLLTMKTQEKVDEEVKQATESTTQMALNAIAERQRLSLALEGGGIATWVWNTKTDELSYDDRLSQLLGCSDELLETGSAFFEMVPKEDHERITASVANCLETGEELDNEFRIVRRDNGQVRWLATRAQILRGDATTLVGVNYDITEQKHHESELAEARGRAEAANRAKGEFLANMSHEIRTPLAAVLGCSDLLYPKLQDDEQRSMLQMVRRQGRLLLELLNDILDLSKIEAGKLDIHDEPCDVRGVAGDIGSLMGPQAGTKGIALDVECDEAVPAAVYVDPLRLRQVLLNLVGNAIKFTENGGVSVRMRAIDRGEKQLVIQIDDTGEGIPEERLKEIFHAFSQADGSITRRYGGTGLGLTICQRLVRMMGGDLSVESEVGRGSTFTVTLPLREADPALLPEGTDSTDDRVPVKTDGKLPIRVLLAEDTQTLRFMLERMVAPHVEEVVAVCDGQQALDAVERATRDEQPFDLILMDMQMPVLDGFDAVGRLREGGYQGLIYAISAGATDSEHRHAMRAGCDSQLDKPVNATKLLEALHSAVTSASRF